MTASTMSQGAVVRDQRTADARLVAVPDRFAVAWQHPTSRAISPVGMLTSHTDGYDFQYLRAAHEVNGFQPLLGFPDLQHRYRSPLLFPAFSQRVMRPSRPDYRGYLNALVLDDTATGWAVLGRSQGQREGDGVRVVPEPAVAADGRTWSTFFVHGLRHRLAQDPAVARALGRLQPGDRLDVVTDPTNPVEPRALSVGEEESVKLAWVPTLLLDYVHEIRNRGGLELTVERVNGDGVPPAHRLLVTVTGTVRPGYGPFSGPAWELAAEHPDASDAGPLPH